MLCFPKSLRGEGLENPPGANARKTGVFRGADAG
jgi:hypothetical protein